MFKYDFGELGVRPMRVNHKLSPSQGWDGEPCLTISMNLVFLKYVSEGDIGKQKIRLLLEVY